MESRGVAQPRLTLCIASPCLLGPPLYTGKGCVCAGSYATGARSGASAALNTACVDHITSTGRDELMRVPTERDELMRVPDQAAASTTLNA